VAGQHANNSTERKKESKTKSQAIHLVMEAVVKKASRRMWVEPQPVCGQPGRV